MPVPTLANALWAAFKVQVELNGGTPALDSDTKDHILSAARWLSDPRGKPGLLLCGLCGNGKTTLAKAIQSIVRWTVENELGYNNRVEPKFRTAKEIVRLLRTNAKEYEKLFTEEMLIIDDLGEEAKEVMMYGMIDTPIVDLVCERYSRRLFTVITTNLNTDEITVKYGIRIADRFAEILTSIIFENDSYRRSEPEAGDQMAVKA